MREMTLEQYLQASAEAGPPDRYPGRSDLAESVLVCGVPLPLPTPRDNTCSPGGLASLFPCLNLGSKTQKEASAGNGAQSNFEEGSQ